MIQPNTPRVSQLHIYSYGIVAADKVLSSNTVEVMPVEDNVLADGVITDNASQYQASGTDAQGNSYQSSLTTTMSVQATWMPLGSNRMTAPDVRSGERVMLYRFGDTDKFYWVTLGSDMALRKLETAVYAWNGSPDASQGTTADNSYFMQVSTHQKLIHVHTSKGNGEVCGFDIQVNPGTGKIQIQDDMNNFFLFDAVNQILQMQNASGAVVQLSKKDLNFQIPGTWTVNAQNVKWNFGPTQMNLGQTTITSQATTHTGPFTENGPYALNGDMTTAPGTGDQPGTGKIQIAGEAELLGSMDVKGNVTAVTIEATTSITAPNLQYN